MAKYKIEFKKSAFKELSTIPKADLKKIVNKINNLAINPMPKGYTKLTGYDLYRIRQGNYRILYSIESHFLIIYIIKIVHRKDVYK